MRNGGGPRGQQVPLQLVSQHRQLLDEFAKGRARMRRLPEPLEQEFRNYCRERAKLARATTALLTAVLFISAPVWSQWPLEMPEATDELTLSLCLLLFGPLFVGLSVLLLLKPRALWVELAFMAAFLLEVAGIELLRIQADHHGYTMIPLISVCVPLAVLSLGRLPARRALVFVLLYGAILAASAIHVPWQRGPVADTSLLTLLVILGIVLVASVFAQRNRRQTWSLIQLTQLGTQIDFLTGLPNRSALERHIEQWTRASRRDSKSYSVAIIDLDYFKCINDRYGHQHGDGVLSDSALTIAGFARRPGDFAARIGGEEFVLFLYDCDRSYAERHLEQVRSSIENLDIENLDSPFGRLTASIGAIAVRGQEAISASYEKADQQLYQAKRSGRNRVLMA